MPYTDQITEITPHTTISELLSNIRTMNLDGKAFFMSINTYTCNTL